MIRHIFVLCAAAALLAAPQALAAQQTIEAGMTRAQVSDRLGSPAAVRDQGTWTYMFYLNNCLPRCGSDDVVFLRDGRVVAAVFRTPARRFRGPDAQRAIAGDAHRPAVGDPGREPRPPRGRLLGEEVRDTADADVRGIRIRTPDDN